MSNPTRATAGGRGARPRRGRNAGRVALVAGVLTATLVAAGCGGAEAPNQGNGEIPAVAQNQTLTVGVATLQQQYADPVLANEGGNTYPIKWSVGEPLIRQDLNMAQVPALATEWTVSDDNLTWDIKLREGVKMHDGSAFTAKDVETSINRVKNPDFTSYQAYYSKIDTVEVVNDHEIKIKTKVPYANLVFDTPAPVATDYYNRVGEEEFRKQPVAAGPFKFDSQVFNESMTLTRFDDFWDAERIPNFANLIMRIIPDESSRLSGIQTGQLDIAQGLTPNSAAQLQGNPSLRLVTSKQASVANVFFVDNWFPEDSPLKNVDVRKALMLAIDRQSIADSLYRGFGSVTVNATLPVTLGNDTSLSAWPYDPTEAKRLLAAAGASDLKFTLHLYNQTTAIADVQKFAEAVIGYWKEVGVDVTMDAMDPATYLDKAVKHQLTGAVILGTPGLLISDPEKLSIFYTSTGGYSAVKNAELDELFAKLSSTVKRDDQAAIAGEISRKLHATLFGLPVVSLDAVYAIGPKVADWKVMDGNPYPGPFWYLRAN
ncbi:ABC transporter substrate-binding protein [Micromonospora zingiberis]|uniref:ABC transporter substrate-binding protein n=1 Tax=Micromonospora zingiberis TaxID=2053011 RepID=A0A4R0GE29_9ACTN|nr:ABC transporter substrate-binding protein [Micromonospora zingiberis]TCB95480.1 ABC transporter substrate-binding protein [Micromonospora zingiberis]